METLQAHTHASALHPPPLRPPPSQAHRSYQRGSARDLLRAVRNCDHLQGMPAEVQRLLLPRPSGIAAYFLPRFPTLFWTLYCTAARSKCC